jgi:hypothetical protein
MPIFPFMRLPYELQLMVLITRFLTCTKNTTSQHPPPPHGPDQLRHLVPSQLTYGRYYVSVTP